MNRVGYSNIEIFIFCALLILGNLVVNILFSGVNSVYGSIFYTILITTLFFLRQNLKLASIGAFLSFIEFIMLFPYLGKYMGRRIDGLYYEHILSLPYKELYNNLVESVYIAISNSDPASIMRGFYILFLYPFINQQIGYESYRYFPVNLMMLSISAVFYIRIIEFYLQNHTSPLLNSGYYNSIKSAAVLLLFISPTILVHSDELLKDIPVLMLILMSTYFYINRNILLCLVSLFFLTLNRAYAPLIVFLYVLAAKKPHRYDYIFMGLFSATMLLLNQFNPVAIMKMIMSVLYVYISPLPINLNNWLMPYTLPTFGGCIFFIGFVGALFMIVFKRYRVFGLNRLPLSICLFGFLLVAIGYNNIVRFRMGDYAGESVGLGDNSFRKIMPIIPLLILQFVTTVYMFFFKNKKIL